LESPLRDCNQFEIPRSMAAELSRVARPVAMSDRDRLRMA
jgi:hypothetical protein